MIRAWEHALDQPGSAGPATIRHGIIFATVVIVLAVIVALFGQIPLTPLPQFTTFHASFVFLVDGITAFLLFGQFVYRQQPSYCILAAAFLFSSLVVLPFVLCFPGALKAEGEFIGGEQSSIWVWHVWHTLFPALVALSLIVHERGAGRLVPRRWVYRSVVAAMTIVVLLVLLISIAVTAFHDWLPVLIHAARVPVKANFYWAGGVAAAVTAAAFLLALRMVARQRTILHTWLALVLLALLADEAASLGAYPRFSLGWYFGRIDWILAASVLLVVFLTDINRLYRRLAEAARDLFNSNRRLSAMVKKRDALVIQLRESEERVRYMAFHDAVTGLPNRRLLMESLTHTLAQASRHGHNTAVLFIDLDRFKEVNDVLGHDVGDALLNEVAIRLKRCVRAGDTLARMGGDEFVILLPEVSGPRDAAAVADKALTALAETMLVMGHRIDITASIGIAMSTSEDRPAADALLRRADEAMYAAKKAGRNRMTMGQSAHLP